MHKWTVKCVGGIIRRSTLQRYGRVHNFITGLHAKLCTALSILRGNVTPTHILYQNLVRRYVYAHSLALSQPVALSGLNPPQSPHHL